MWLRLTLMVLVLGGLVYADDRPEDCSQRVACSRCDPGNSKAANGAIRCWDCDTHLLGPDCVPQITCQECYVQMQSRGAACRGCTLLWQDRTP